MTNQALSIVPASDHANAGVNRQDVGSSYPSIAHFQVLNTLLQNREFTEELVETGHHTYQTQIARVASTPCFTAGMPAAERERVIATGIAPFYAIDGLITQEWLRHKRSPLATLNAIIDDPASVKGVTELGLLANATWKAGQPFRGLGRIERPVFRSLVTLEQEELDKDHVLVKAMAEKLRDRMVEELHGAYAEELRISLFSRIDRVIEVFDTNARAQGIVYDDVQLNALRKTARDCMFSHAGQTRKNGEPYFVHLLDVAENAVSIFNVTDIRLMHVAFKHDMREDQQSAYELRKLYRLNKLARDNTLAGDEEERLAQAEKLADFYLELVGVRMLSKLEAGAPQIQKSALTKDDAKIVTYEHIADPRRFYDDQNRGEYSDEWIAGIQKIKLADIVSNTATITDPLLPTETFTPGPHDLDFPSHFLHKVLDFAVPYFVNYSKFLDQPTLTAFYRTMESTLRSYALPASVERSPAHARLASEIARPGGFMEQLAILKEQALAA